MRPAILSICLLILMLFSIPGSGQTVIQSQLPAGAAPYTVTIYDTSYNDGYYFTGAYKLSSAANYPSALMVMDAKGYPVFYRALAINAGTWADLRVYPNGLMSYFHYNENTEIGKYFIMDSTFTVIDSVECDNGYKTDGHEMLMMDNGNYYIICLEQRITNLSPMLTNDGFIGDPTGLAIAAVIQELDTNKNAIFQWHALDHYSITDMDRYFFLDPQFMDFGHPNSIAIDTNGDILLSNRFFNEITKISRADSSIIWRLGGKQNQFTFINDTLSFSAQHNIEILPNGNITLFDNGERTTPPWARGVEYELDEVNLRATRVWAFRNEPGIMSYALGSMQRLDSGNSLISWGAGENPGFDNDFMELTNDLDTVFTFDYPQDYFIYRTYKQNPSWDMEALRPEIACDTTQEGMHVIVADTSISNVYWSNGDTGPQISIDTTGVFFYYTPTDKGFFFSKTLEIEDLSNPCKFVFDTIIDTIIDTTSIFTPVKEASIHVYPNPANDHLVIATEGSLKGSQLSIQNMLGQVVIDQEIVDDQQLINTNELTEGLYIGTIITGNSNLQFKFMVRH